MTGSLRHLLDCAFDYAGLFPPSALDMEQTCANYARHLYGNETWILNRFVCPVARLVELAPFLNRYVRPHDEWQITVIGSSLATFSEDRKAIDAFQATSGGKAAVGGYEVRASPAELTSAALKGLVDADFDDVYVELPLGSDSIPALELLASGNLVGAKARAGGPEAAAFPDVSTLATFLQHCIQLELPFKLTAGLHHPIRRFDSSVNAEMHGFLNVALAGAFSLAHDLRRSEIEQLLTESDASRFTFSDFEIAWNEFDIGIDAIDEFRELFGSIGSCSIDEPVQDLTALGLI